jgi:hypothetical protein
MKNILVCLCCLCALPNATAQQNASSFVVGSELSSAISGNKSQFVRTFDDRFKDATKGSPFLFDEWVPGTLILSDLSRTNDSFLFKFDTYHKEVWARKIGGDSVIPYADYIRQIDLRHPDGRTWVFKKYSLEPSGAVQFYQPVYEGTKFTLVKEERKILVKANFVERGVYTTGLPYDRYEGLATEYFIQTQKDQPFKKISLKKNALTDLVPARHAEEVEAFCKKEKIHKTLTEQEAAKLLGFLDR